MKVLKLKKSEDTPKGFTGIIEEPDGDRYWFKDGMAHREDGPSAMYHTGVNYWYLNDIKMTEEEHTKQTAPLRTTLGKLILNEHFTLGDENASED